MFRVSTRARKRNGFASSLAIALALTTAGGVAFSAPAQAQSEKPEYSKDFAKLAQKTSENLNAVRNSPEVVAEINNLVAASNEQQAAKGEAAIAAANAKFAAVAQRIQGLTAAQKQEVLALAPAAKNPDDKFLAGDLINFLGTFSGDRPLRAQGLKLKLDSGKLKPELVTPSWFELGQLYYAANRTDEARSAFDTAYKGGDTNAAIYVADTYYSSNRVVEGLDYLEGVIKARTAAGQRVEQGWYANGLTRARDLGDPARLAHWAGLYAAGGNSPQSWSAGTQMIIGSTQYGSQELLDAYRLLKRTNALLTTTDYIKYIDAANPRTMSNEVLPLLTEAAGKGLLPANPDAPAGFDADVASFTKRSLATAKATADEDRAQVAGYASEARSDKGTGVQARNAGDIYLSLGSSAEAEEMFKLALTLGGADNDRVYTRLGIAQADQGKIAEARESFGKVTGVRAPIAGLWLAYLGTKG